MGAIPMSHSNARHGAIFLATGLVLCGLAMPGRAAPLEKGKSVALRGTTAAKMPALAGEVQMDRLIDFEIRNAAGDLVFKGKLQDRVVLSTLSGTLCFSSFIRDTRKDLPGVITSVTRSGFADVSADVEFRVDGMGHIGPKTAERNAKGDEITFHFTAAQLHAATDSRFFFITTNATEYATDQPGTTILRTADGSSVRLATSVPLPVRRP
jgi:hypothetical protein